MLGLSLGLDMLQQKDTFAIPHRNVKWLHYSSSGRSLKKLLLVWAAVVCAAAGLRYVFGLATTVSGTVAAVTACVYYVLWLYQEARTMEVAYSRGHGRPIVPLSSKFAGMYESSMWSFRLPAQTVDGAAQEDEVIQSLISHKVGKPVAAPSQPISTWYGKSSGCDKGRNQLELHSDHIQLVKTSGCCGCSGRPCGSADKYVVALQDITFIETTNGVQQRLLLQAVVAALVVFVGYAGFEYSTRREMRLLVPFICAGVVFGVGFLRFYCAREASINIGVSPGGSSNGTLNPYTGDSPFWIMFRPQRANETVGEIIPLIQQAMAAGAVSWPKDS